jgi:hypothetical protein
MFNINNIKPIQTVSRLICGFILLTALNIQAQSGFGDDVKIVNSLPEKELKNVDSLRVDMYLGRLEILINAIREEFNAPVLPFVAGQVFDVEKRREFNEMLLKLPQFIRHTGVATSEGATSFDGTHFDSESAIIIGERFSDELVKLLSQKKTKKN